MKLGPEEIFPPVYRYSYSLEPIQVRHEIHQADIAFTCAFHGAHQCRFESEGQKADHDVPPDPALAPVIDGTQLQARLHLPKGPFDLPQALVGQCHLRSRKRGICPKDPFAVVFGFLLYSFLVDFYLTTVL